MAEVRRWRWRPDVCVRPAILRAGGGMLDAHGPRRLCCEGLHVSAGGLTNDLIHFTTSLLITAVLLVLTLRAARLPGTPVANILFAVCGILWRDRKSTRLNSSHRC